MRNLLSGLAVVGLVAAACGSGEPAVETAATIPTSVAPSATSTSETTSPPTVNTTQPLPTSSHAPDPTTDATTATTGDQPERPLPELAYEQLESSVEFPVLLLPLPGTDMLVIASKEGTLWLHDGVGQLDDPFLDISDLVRNDGEQGLLGFAFAPDYESSGRLFVHFSDNGGDTVIAEFRASGTAADRTTLTELFRRSQPARNHNGGMIQFGPDGMLYVGLGDGGGANDRFGHGQDGGTSLGALLRFDVSTPGTATAAGAEFEHPAVWAIGLRNPWRFDIDGPSGLVIIADVGQNAFEEISVAPIGEPGHDYGWPTTEGLHCFSPSTGCDTSGITLPIIEVSHSDSSTCSITGGSYTEALRFPRWMATTSSLISAAATSARFIWVAALPRSSTGPSRSGREPGRCHSVTTPTGSCTCSPPVGASSRSSPAPADRGLRFPPGGQMEQLKNIPMATLAIIVGIVTAVAWISLDGTVPLIVSIVGGGLIAVKASLGEDE